MSIFSYKDITIADGKMGSVTLAHYTSMIGREQEIISFMREGRAPSKETVYVEEAAESLGVRHHVVYINWFEELLGRDFVSERATEEPMVFLSIAYALGVRMGAARVNYSAYRKDITSYSYFRPNFISSLSAALQYGSNSYTELVAPFIHMRLAEIVKIGTDLGVDYRRTWSCRETDKYHCGKCDGCTERKSAFKINGMEDPTIYSE